MEVVAAVEEEDVMAFRKNQKTFVIQFVDEAEQFLLHIYQDV